MKLLEHIYQERSTREDAQTLPQLKLQPELQQQPSARETESGRIKIRSFFATAVLGIASIALGVAIYTEVSPSFLSYNKWLENHRFMQALLSLRFPRTEPTLNADGTWNYRNPIHYYEYDSSGDRMFDFHPTEDYLEQPEVLDLKEKMEANPVLSAVLTDEMIQYLLLHHVQLSSEGKDIACRNSKATGCFTDGISFIDASVPFFTFSTFVHESGHVLTNVGWGPEIEVGALANGSQLIITDAGNLEIRDAMGKMYSFQEIDATILEYLQYLGSFDLVQAMMIKHQQNPAQALQYAKDFGLQTNPEFAANQRMYFRQLLIEEELESADDRAQVWALFRGIQQIHPENQRLLYEIFFELLLKRTDPWKTTADTAVLDQSQQDFLKNYVAEFATLTTRKDDPVEAMNEFQVFLETFKKGREIISH
ncbi:MAG: hypothetical protein UX04_C0005G0015 [Microgenomates group bacterium GW2011_GWF2_45_18]|nr:MAG: hypothetical protein UW18_C0007G0016 [Microgenomates group bacterium GW2011_GWF1_44_10]KKU01596.1 MAG: hypothetical protein UX04_C0005G0015 [Microgenomates group bacterium GW2011_GWF2_45_18]OGJ41551.1 MAG: hypothetical protein A2378_01420 [Candidatus Pacebacteria bacterium RIFOXYB1_FULL_44_10]HAU99523.1 hypothetical protein [Candidatus Paceibacterota bacterium]HAX01334.1 hypothetical protein [Candidatus Paceibacterota bacterium]